MCRHERVGEKTRCWLWVPVKAKKKKQNHQKVKLREGWGMAVTARRGGAT